MKQTWIIGCVALSVTLAAACGGGGGSTAASSPAGSVGASSSAPPVQSAASDDGCSLLTDDEVTAVIGSAVTRREPSPKTAASFGCVKGTDRAADLSTAAFVSVSVFTAGREAMLDEIAADAGTEEISGLGDRALYQPAGGFVFILKGSTVVSVQVFKLGQPGSRDDVLSLGRSVLPRV